MEYHARRHIIHIKQIIEIRALKCGPTLCNIEDRLMIWQKAISLTQGVLKAVYDVELPDTECFSFESMIISSPELML